MKLSARVFAAGTYFLKVRSRFNSDHARRRVFFHAKQLLTIRVMLSSKPTKVWILARRPLILKPTLMKASCAGHSDVDYYKFSVDQRVKLSIPSSSEKSMALVGTMSLVGGWKSFLALVTCVTHCVAAVILSAGVQAGTYFLKVRCKIQLVSSRRRVLFHDQQCDDSSDVEFEANDSLSDAQPFP